MNIVKELRKKKGVQQKELAIDIGVSQPTVSDWEANKKDPSGERLKKLAEYFEVDELVVLGKGIGQESLYTPKKAPDSNASETEQIVQRLLDQLGEMPKTAEARIVSGGMDKLPKEQRELILNMVSAMFPNKFTKGDDDEA